MRKIVIPSDFSENAMNALKYAVELFKHEISEFHILHAFAEEVYNNKEILTRTAMDAVKEDLQKKYEAQLKMVFKEIQEYSPNPRHRFQTHVAFGHLIDELNELVDKEEADIAIMGTRGKTNDKQLTFGSNTLQVIKYVQCPVLAIPENYKFHDLQHILFPTNFMLPYQKRELKLVAEISKSFPATIHMLYISNFPIESLRQKENFEFIKDQFMEKYFQYNRVNEAAREQVIFDQLEQLNIDLLVMVNSRHTYLENILFESTIDKISLYPTIPFLVLQNFYRECR